MFQKEDALLHLLPRGAALAVTCSLFSRKSQEKGAPRPSTRVSRKNALDVSRRAFHGVKQVERALSGKRAAKASNDRVQTRDDDVAVGCARAASLRGAILPPRNPDDDSRMRTTTGCGQT